MDAALEKRGYSRQEALEILQSTFDFKGEKNHFVLRRGTSQSFGQNVQAGEQSYLAKLKHPSEEIGLGDMFEHLTVLFEVVMNEVKKEYGDSGWARVYISHPPTGEHFIVKAAHIQDMTPEFIMDVVSKQINSADFVPCDKHLEIYVAAVKHIRGKGYRNIQNLARDKRLKKSIIPITAEDNLCLPRAIGVGYALLLKNEALKNTSLNDEERKKISNRYTYIKRANTPQQKKRALELLRQVCLDRNHVGTLSDIPLYEDLLGVSISVVSLLNSAQPVYSGKEEFSARKMILLHTHPDNPQEVGHFDLVTSLTGVFCRHYVCPDCLKVYNTRGMHSCKSTCNVCGFENCIKIQNVQCKLCHRICRSETCLKRHQNGFKGKTGKQVSSICQQGWKCPDCSVFIPFAHNSARVKSHACGEVCCSGCKQFFLNKHLCHMRIPSIQEPNKRFVFFDFECMQDTGKHVPNLVVAQTSCPLCQDFTLDEQLKCSECGYRCSGCASMSEGVFATEPCGETFECGSRRKCWKGPNCRDDFCTWLLSNQNKHAKVFAHNAKGYDAYFILAFLRDQNLKPSKIIMNGAKIMYMKLGDSLGVEVLDSVNFLPMALSSLPKSFGLTELKKGFFPYLFNTVENQNKILDHLPGIHFYNPDCMYEDRRKEFLRWYEENKDSQFDFQQEMLDYCISDVTILQEACMKFRNLVLEETGKSIQHGLHKIPRKGVDPFSYITIASLCLGILRRKYLPEQHRVLLKEKAITGCAHGYFCKCIWMEGRKLSEDHPLEIWNSQGFWEVVDENAIECDRFSSSPVGLIPTDEYGSKGRHSSSSLEWIEYIQDKLRKKNPSVRVSHARNGGEHIVLYKNEQGIKRYKLDGYYVLQGKQHALEFYGCVWHGCKNCFKTGRYKRIVHGKSFAELYSETMLREERLRSMGYSVHSIWECQFKQLKTHDSQLGSFLEKHSPIISPLLLRDAYFGGRTNAIVLHKKLQEGEKGLYVDFTSLYPDVMKYQRYPVGHPVKLFSPPNNLQSETCDGKCLRPRHCKGFHVKIPYFGIMKVTVLPPTDLLYPILPVKITGKLMFPLCRNCAAKNQTKTQCQCSDQDRQFIETYCTPELELALNNGYKLVKIHEVLDWHMSEEYNAKTKKGGLFTDYINTFLKMKQQASGYPDSVKTEEEKRKYVEDYFEHEGILLESSSIEKNPGLRSLAKLCLNSVYGKFGQRADLRRTTYISTDLELYNLFLDHSKRIQDFSIVSESVMQVSWSPSEYFEPLSCNSNVVLALFCTAYARLKLLKLMYSVENRVLYHDTDSVIFTCKVDQYYPPLGSYLGDLTDELTCQSLKCSKTNCEGHFIQEFISCGPKNYAYKLNSGQVVCKIRGFSLNYSNSQILNFESMKNSLQCWKDNDETKIVTVKTEIRRDPKNVEIVNKKVVKKYGVVFDKRVVLDDFSSIPFGFRGRSDC